MSKFVRLCNADKKGKPVHVNAENILWFEQVGPQETILTFVSDKKLVILGPHDDVIKALDNRDKA
jgi:hypothetical protein